MTSASLEWTNNAWVSGDPYTTGTDTREALYPVLVHLGGDRAMALWFYRDTALELVGAIVTAVPGGTPQVGSLVTLWTGVNDQFEWDPTGFADVGNDQVILQFNTSWQSADRTTVYTRDNVFLIGSDGEVPVLQDTHVVAYDIPRIPATPVYRSEWGRVARITNGKALWFTGRRPYLYSGNMPNDPQWYNRYWAHVITVSGQDLIIGPANALPPGEPNASHNGWATGMGGFTQANGGVYVSESGLGVIVNSDSIDSDNQVYPFVVSGDVVTFSGPVEVTGAEDAEFRQAQQLAPAPGTPNSFVMSYFLVDGTDTMPLAIFETTGTSVTLVQTATEPHHLTWNDQDTAWGAYSFDTGIVAPRDTVTTGVVAAITAPQVGTPPTNNVYQPELLYDVFFAEQVKSRMPWDAGTFFEGFLVTPSPMGWRLAITGTDLGMLVLTSTYWENPSDSSHYKVNAVAVTWFSLKAPPRPPTSRRRFTGRRH